MNEKTQECFPSNLAEDFPFGGVQRTLDSLKKMTSSCPTNVEPPRSCHTVTTSFLQLHLEREPLTEIVTLFAVSPFLTST